MKNVVLIDLEKNPLQADQIRPYVEQGQPVYLFHLTGRFDYAFEEMTELASWITSGYVMLLDVPKIAKKEFEYAVIAGQLMALVEPDAQIELISKSASIYLLVDILQHSGRPVQHLHNWLKPQKSGYALPGPASFKAQPLLQQIKKYCDAVGNMQGLPSTPEGLKNSIGNILKLSDDQIHQIVAMLIKLKIIRKDTTQIHFRKKILKQWLNLKLEDDQSETTRTSAMNVQSGLKNNVSALTPPQVVVGDVETIMQFLQQQQSVSEGPFPPELDELQWQAVQKLDGLQHERPKDIFSLRDQLHDWFPKADVHLLLKSLLDKGYIQLNDDQLHYSMQMVIH